MQNLTSLRGRRAFTVAAVVAVALLFRTGVPAPDAAAGVTDTVTGERIGELLFGVTPARLLDTRPAATADGLHSGVGFLAKDAAPYALDIRGRVNGLVPPSATGVMVNVTVVDPSAAGYLTVWPEGANPGTSNVNFGAKQTTANLVFVAIGTDGKIRLDISEADAHIVVDVVAFTSDLPTI